MRFSTLALTSASAGIAAAAPFAFPLANGFPNLNSTAMQEVFKLAGGTLPNGALPTSLKAAGIQAVQLLAANELFEVAYFAELMANITNKVEGYEADPYTIKTLEAVVNQEQVHVLAVEGVLASANATTIQPCQYSFPVTNLADAIALAELFTEVVLGVLPVVQTIFAGDGGDEMGLVQILGSIIAQEGEQVGYYRALQKKVASSAPLLTAGAPQFAYTAVAQFLVPGSCPNIDVIGITALPTLTVETTPKAMNSTQMFSVMDAGSTVSAANNTLVYISGQNMPVSVPITGVNHDSASGKTYFFASFPYEAGFARGLTLGTLVGGAGAKFMTTAAVAAADVMALALIDVD